MEIETILRKRKGFETMSPERLHEVTSLGGKATQKAGKAYRWTPEQASEAGKIGGRISKRRPRQAYGN